MSGDRSAKRTWSLAIHGGAGSSPESWGAEKCAARSQGLLVALAAGRNVLEAGGTALDAVEAAVVALEDDGNFHAGRGATRTCAGEVELDAAIMDGANADSGAVACIRVTPHPIRVARRVMQVTPHVLLVGAGADAFATQQGFPAARPSDFRSVAEPRSTPSSDDDSNNLKFGTVGCVARDEHGNLAAATSTSGTRDKMPGRVGDSPIIGAGTFAANRYGAVSATGLGEEFMRRCVAYDLIAQVRYAQRTLASAAGELFRERLPASAGGVIAIDAYGEITVVHNTPGMSWGVADSGGRWETGLTT